MTWTPQDDTHLVEDAKLARRCRLLLKYTGTADEFASAAAQRAPEFEVHILLPGQPLEISPRLIAKRPGSRASTCAPRRRGCWQ
jgi:hypothetical protein